MGEPANILDSDPYGLPRAEKQQLLLERLNALELLHYRNCEPFRRILNAYGHSPGSSGALEDLPFLPVRLFKEMSLKSVPDDQVIKTLLSSGTTGQAQSRIYLDAATASLQTRTLVRLMQTVLGKQRLPMIVIDHPAVIKNPASFSARGAGIIGLLNFGRQPIYALKGETMAIDVDAIVEFVKSHRDTPVFLFGFTFMVWKHFVRALEESGRSIPLSKGILVHSGGWKKLLDEAVDNTTFKQRLKAVTGIERVHNFYGMVEQVGSIHVECEHGHLHAPSTSDIIVRDPADWSVLPHGAKGVIQTVSALPQSYPGHSLMSEDFGTILGEDDCPCGRKGKYFEVHGRVPQAEVRGCSDTFAQAAA